MATGVKGWADAFTDYALAGSFSLPAASPFDVLADGRLITLSGADVYTETAVGSGSFTRAGSLAGMDVPGYAAAFVRVSPDGSTVAIGNNGGASYGNYEVGVFDLGTLNGHWFGVHHFDAEWIDGKYLAVTTGVFGHPSVVTAFDTSSSPSNPVNPTIVANVGGSSAGVTFDGAGNLYTGNGYAGAGPSDTGWIKAFSSSEWAAAMSGGAPADFETSGTLIGDVLSAGSLGFDAEGNLHVGGGDFLGGGETDNAALINAAEILDALAGGGPLDPTDPAQVRRFDPDAVNPYNYYDVNYNAVTGELYLREGGTVYAYVVPEPSALTMLVLAGIVGMRRHKC